jgi:DNA invertase Pin-like site-specific DNA recombinase
MLGTDAPPARMIGYCRVSTDEQAMSGLGLADQEKRIREMAKPHGWRIVQMIRDEGLSAGTLERAGLYRALGQLAAGRADGLVVAKLDRLTRSTVDFGLLLEWFKDAGKTLVLLDLGVDTSTAGGELVANVIDERRAVGARRDQRAHPRRARAAPSAGQAHRPARRRRRPGAPRADPRDARRGAHAPPDLRPAQRRGRAHDARRREVAAVRDPERARLQAPAQAAPRRRAPHAGPRDAHPARAPAAALRGHAGRDVARASAAASTRSSPAGTRSSAAA